MIMRGGLISFGGGQRQDAMLDKHQLKTNAGRAKLGRSPIVTPIGTFRDSALRRSVVAWRSDERGATAIEQAVFVAAIAVGLLAAGRMVSENTAGLPAAVEEVFSATQHQSGDSDGTDRKSDPPRDEAPKKPRLRDR